MLCMYTDVLSLAVFTSFRIFTRESSHPSRHQKWQYPFGNGWQCQTQYALTQSKSWIFTWTKSESWKFTLYPVKIYFISNQKFEFLPSTQSNCSIFTLKPIMTVILSMLIFLYSWLWFLCSVISWTKQKVHNGWNTILDGSRGRHKVRIKDCLSSRP